jgi:thermostable 8-oxoguanine DNA glycosylase
VTPVVVRPSPRLTIEEAWEVCRDLYEGLSHCTSPKEVSLDDELLFCLLGGYGVSYELNRSAADVLKSIEPFDRAHDEDLLHATLETTLDEPRYEPRKKDGALRRYRYPSRKASLIIAARRWLLEQPPIQDLLTALPTEQRRREHLCQCPGVGLKTASWLLRNLGLARNLAILDIHLVRALTQSGRLTFEIRLPRDYELVERAFVGWCTELDADPGAFDLFVWEWQRGALTA